MDVIRAAHASRARLARTRPGRYLVTATDTVVAVSGQTPDRLKNWFSLFAFDPITLSTARKYFVCVDELTTLSPIGPRRCLFPPRWTLVFSGEAAFPDQGSEADTEDAQRIAALRRIAGLLRDDVQHATNDPASDAANATVASCGMLMNQVFRDALLEFDRFPALAKQLDSNSGVAFSHVSLDGGRVYMSVRDGVAVARIEVGLPPASPESTFVADFARVGPMQTIPEVGL
jgi:hypothetical protein